jgi:hypothetical protein
MGRVEVREWISSCRELQGEGQERGKDAWASTAWAVLEGIAFNTRCCKQWLVVDGEVSGDDDDASYMHAGNEHNSSSERGGCVHEGNRIKRGLTASIDGSGLARSSSWLHRSRSLPGSTCRGVKREHAWAHSHDSSHTLHGSWK